ncbi:hypothetical protein AB0952_11400 [Streptomyces caniferus]|uniref:hypothetical protein n=1 Tax=Streptomyces caniferus TaxID=285557 RepID=UPI0034532BD8
MNDNPDYFLRENFGTTELGEPASTAYLGVKEGLTYIAPFVEDRFLTERTGERTTPVGDPPGLAKQWASADADLAILVAPTDVVDSLAEPGDIRAVARIHQVVDTSGGHEHVMTQLLSRREGRRRRNAHRDGFSYDVSHRDEDFYEFYRTMHLPTMHTRYADRARSVEEDQAYRTLFREGVLFRVLRSEEWVAGSVCRIDRESRTLNARLIGIKDGSDTLREAGAQTYIYYANLDWAACEDSIDTLDFQGCEPFLTKGTFQYKKRFGTTAVIPRNNVFGGLRMLIRPNALTPSVRRFLVNNPVMAESSFGGGELIAKYFYDQDNALRSDILHNSPGITESVSINLDEL